MTKEQVIKQLESLKLEAKTDLHKVHNHALDVAIQAIREMKE